MAKRKPRARKAAAPARARRPVGPLWWGTGLLALGWIAFDANRPAVERHLPQLAELRLPWQAAEAPDARREAAPARPVPARVAKAERPTEPRPAAPKAPPAAAVSRSAVPEARPVRTAPSVPGAPVRPAAATSGPAAAPAATLPAAGSQLVTRAPLPLRRAPAADAPVWMVLDAGRPLRVTRRDGAFARVESGIFTGWVEAARIGGGHETRPAPRGTMPTLAAEARRIGPVPAATVPGAAR